MKPHQTTLPGLITGELETIECRGAELAHLEEKLRAESRRIIAMTAVCQSSWRCVVAPMPATASILERKTSC